MKPIRTVIMGAAGRDFHNFNTVYRDNPRYDVVAFTATQIPNIDDRKYPASLAGKLYPKGIPILAEKDLEQIIGEHKVQEVVFAYSDVTYNYVMDRGSIVNAAGADFKILGAATTMLKSKKPVISICAVRTGSGKSQTTRRIAGILREAGLKVAAVRHPMPYGNLEKQRVQRFGSIADLKKHDCTIEEIEEYEPHIVSGTIIYAGVDYGDILAQAQAEADVVLWDGGNNDTPFYKPDLHIVVADPLRVGNELLYHPSETNLRLADVVIINKVDTADITATNALRANIRRVNGRAVIIEAASPITVTNPEHITGKRVLVVEDGPTLTHGEMKFGAGVVAAGKFSAAEIVDPAALHRRDDYRDVQEIPRHRRAAAGHGLRRQAGEGPRDDHQPHPLRHRHHRHADRPQPAHQDQEADRAGELRAAGDREAGPDGCAGAVSKEEARSKK